MSLVKYFWLLILCIVVIIYTFYLNMPPKLLMLKIFQTLFLFRLTFSISFDFISVFYTMDEELKTKIKKAESLRERRGFLQSLFGGPDYLESAALFTEVAKFSTSVEDKIKYYEEAANTYLLEKNEYGIWKAAECFGELNKLAKNKEKSKAFFLSRIDCLMKIGKYMIAGQALTTEGEKNNNLETSLELFTKASEAFKLDGSSPFHLKKALEHTLLLQLKAMKIKEAIDTMKYMDESYKNMKHFKLCIQMLLFLQMKENSGTVFDAEDVLESDESKVIMGLFNSEEPGVILEEFQNENVLSETVEMVFEICKKSLKPELDIC